MLLNRSVTGYEVRAVGFNPDAAEYGGISAGRNYVKVMLICGAFAGLAGAIDVIGWQFRIATIDVQVANLGFYGIAVALLGRNTAVGTAVAALLFAALLNGTSVRNLDPTVFAPELAGNLTWIIQGLIVLFVSAPVLRDDALAQAAQTHDGRGARPPARRPRRDDGDRTSRRPWPPAAGRRRLAAEGAPRARLARRLDRLGRHPPRAAGVLRRPAADHAADDRPCRSLLAAAGIALGGDRDPRRREADRLGRDRRVPARPRRRLPRGDVRASATSSASSSGRRCWPRRCATRRR